MTKRSPVPEGQPGGGSIHFRRCVAAGQRGGELGSETDAPAFAKFFVVTIQGMRAMARLKSDRRALRQVARIALAVFDR